LIKNCNLLFPPSYRRRSLQPSKENIQDFNANSDPGTPFESGSNPDPEHWYSHTAAKRSIKNKNNKNNKKEKEKYEYNNQSTKK
jgi:hypothetical protein